MAHTRIGQTDSYPVPYANQAAFSLGRILKGFPCTEQAGLGPGTILKCRDWMSTNQSWKVENADVYK